MVLTAKYITSLTLLERTDKVRMNLKDCIPINGLAFSLKFSSRAMEICLDERNLNN